MKRQIIAVSKRDSRIVGVVDYGSTSEGRGDEWSDLDIALFIRDSDIDLFEKNWVEWASQFGTLLVAFISGVERPWAVYDATPIPLRVDFALYRGSSVEDILTWPNSPISVEAMVWYDATPERKLSACVRQIVGQSLAPLDLHNKFDRVCGAFWYYMLRTYVRLLRGEQWAARHDFNFIIVGNLLSLLRLEFNATEHWRGSSASSRIEQVLSLERLSELEKCIPGPGEENLQKAMIDAASMGYDVCNSIAWKRQWEWPITLAERTQTLLKQERR